MNDTPSDARRASTAILVVEANAIVRSMLRRALERRNHHVLVAANAEAALALFRHAEDPIGLVITEQQLAGMDGTRLADTLRRDDPTLPILLIGSGFEGASGDYPELDKPFTLGKLEQRIDAVLGETSTGTSIDSPGGASDGEFSGRSPAPPRTRR